jgi:hypothetical protein
VNSTQPYRSRQGTSPTWAANAFSVPTNYVFDYSEENLVKEKSDKKM